MIGRNRKYYFPGFLLALLLMLGQIGCSQEVADRDTVLRDGVLYLRGADEPFTGFVIGKSREGYRTQTCSFKKQYKNGALDGITSFWFPNGKLESTIPYKDGEIHGFFTRYWDNGKPRERIHFSQGLRGGSGGEMFWDKNGNQVKS
jgi:hypothetical protein